MLSKPLIAQAQKLLGALAARGLMLATAESCTGGLLAALFTEIPGSSRVFERGFVTYSNESKTQMLGVPAEMIERHGAVSDHVAKAMAKGALKNSQAQLAVSITGIAGPGGGSLGKPVGLVYIGLAGPKMHIEECQFKGNRSDIRQAAIIKALDILKAAQ